MPELFKFKPTCSTRWAKLRDLITATAGDVSGVKTSEMTSDGVVTYGLLFDGYGEAIGIPVTELDEVEVPEGLVKPE